MLISFTTTSLKHIHRHFIVPCTFCCSNWMANWPLHWWMLSPKLYPVNYPLATTHIRTSRTQLSKSLPGARALQVVLLQRTISVISLIHNAFKGVDVRSLIKATIYYVYTSHVYSTPYKETILLFFRCNNNSHSIAIVIREYHTTALLFTCSIKHTDKLGKMFRCVLLMVGECGIRKDASYPG